MDIFKEAAERFEKGMLSILLKHHDDPERCHAEMDDLMCKTLEEFGCCEGVKIFKQAEKWYS